ncbi:hypothetical protein Purlil1_11530 [Purpureocillium lilacinum]|uniref:Uncharacterized protein n=1 Tax=Purpureocillium lilacinum TaxID=33203 RepID=A0ABR0BJB7_PURLI|nr:hypothetical protein Purlil1_11530 [Purpureocillium lilacinum]
MHARYVRRGHASSQPFRGNTTTPAEVQGRFPATASDDMHSLTHTHALTHSLTHSSSKADVVVLVFPAFKHQYLDNQLPFPLGVMCTVPDAAKEGFHLAATGLEGGGERRGPPPCFRACKPVGRRGRRFSAKSAGCVWPVGVGGRAAVRNGPLGSGPKFQRLAIISARGPSGPPVGAHQHLERAGAGAPQPTTPASSIRWQRQVAWAGRLWSARALWGFGIRPDSGTPSPVLLVRYQRTWMDTSGGDSSSSRQVWVLVDRRF